MGISMDLTIAGREADTPVGGQLQLFSESWKRIFRDTWILEVIAGCKLEFFGVSQHRLFPQVSGNRQSFQTLDEKLGKLATKQAIERVSDLPKHISSAPCFW